MRDPERSLALEIPLLAVALAACGGGAAPEGDVTVRDSAGVRIVENREGRWGPGEAWTVAENPLLDIGAVGGAPEEQFGDVEGVVRLEGGPIVVADGAARELRFFTAAGEFLGRAGGEGGGPGEFGQLNGVHAYPGDSVAAWDARGQRVAIFGPDRGFGRETGLRDAGGVASTLHGVLSDGSLVVEPAGSLGDLMARGEKAAGRDTVAFLRYGRDGRLADTLARMPGPETVVLRRGITVSRRSVLFGRDSHAAVGDDRVYVGESGAFRITVLGPGGRPLGSIRWSGELDPVDEGQLRRAREEARAEQRRTMEELADRLSRPLDGGEEQEELPARSTVPAFDRLLVDADGSLWVREHLTPGDAPRTWQVFGPDGRWLGDVTTPAGLEVRQIGPDWLLGVGTDELGTEHVRLHRLDRSPAPDGPARGR